MKSGNNFIDLREKPSLIDGKIPLDQLPPFFVHDDTVYLLGEIGTVGAGVAAVPPGLLPDGYVRLSGHYDRASENFGNVMDPTGSIMVHVAKFYFRWTLNWLEISPIPATGFVLHRAFIDGGAEKNGVLVDKYQCGNVNGIFTSIQGIDPCSTSAAHNPISALNNTPANNYGGLYKAVKTRSDNHFLTSIFIYNALAMIAYAQGKTGTNCAFASVPPAMPKGNNNNALHDTNDASVSFTGSGYSNCALTGSGVPLEKTTHNGQKSGVADLNGNMYEVASGFIKFGTTDAIFKLLKESVSIAACTFTDSTSGGAYDATFYDDLDLTGTMTTATATRFGNGTNQVFEMSTDRNSLAYKKTTAGLPMANGYSAAGTTEFGQDYYYQELRDQLAPLVGGYWSSTSYAGVFSLVVGLSRTNSYDNVGGRASVYL